MIANKYPSFSKDNDICIRIMTQLINKLKYNDLP